MMKTTNNPILGCSWFPFSDDPLLSGSWYVPSFCDPQVILPDDSPDRRWHMFVHSWIGIHHFVSDSGIAWEPVKMLAVRGHFPFVYKENETFYLLYEKHDVSLSTLSGSGASRFEIMSSKNLTDWKTPKVLFDSRSIPFACDYLKKSKISRPQLMKIDNRYRLFYGASEVLLSDTKQKVTRYLAYASSDTIEGKYECCDKPIMEPVPDDPYSNLAVGSVRLFNAKEGIFALQCAFGWDYINKKTISTVWLLESQDGINFNRCNDKPFMIPQKDTWAGRYIKSCDICFKEDENCWYCYFSSCGQRVHLTINESVGLFIGAVR